MHCTWERAMDYQEIMQHIRENLDISVDVERTVDGKRRLKIKLIDTSDMSDRRRVIAEDWVNLSELVD